VSGDYRFTKSHSGDGAEVGVLVTGWAQRSVRVASLAVLAIGAAILILVASPRPSEASELKVATSPTVAVQVMATTFGDRVVAIAKRYLGYRYRSGGILPRTGFDCSGFTYYVFKTAGRPISRSLSVQRWSGVPVSRWSLKPGDLVFFKNTYRTGLSHVGIYVGAGKFINAQSERVGVAIASLGSRYWSSHYLAARRK
jgi:cell wall-associated NlpC family hydrolase